MWKNIGWSELIITIITLCLSIIFFTIVNEDYGSFTMNMAAGQFSPFSLIDWYYLGLIGISPFLRFLHDFFPLFNWLGIFFMLVQIITLYYFLISTRRAINPEGKNPFLTLAIQVLIALFFIDNFITLSHTRFSLLLCGISLFNLAFIKNIGKKEILINSLIFIFGMLIRPESSVGMLVFVSVGYIIYNIDFFHLAKRFSIPVFATIILLSAIAIDWHFTDTFVRKIEPEIEYNFMVKKAVDLSEMKSAEDSVKHQVALSGMWFDPQVITPEFMRTLIIPGFVFNISQADKAFSRMIALHYYYMFFAFSAVALLGLSIFYIKSLKTTLKILVLYAFTFLLLYYLAYQDLLAERHFFAFIVLSVLISIYYFRIDFQSKIRTIRIPVAIIIFSFLSFGMALTLTNYKIINDHAINNIRCFEQTMVEIEKNLTDRIIIIPTSSIYLLDHPFSIYNSIYINNTYLMFDTFNYSLLPRYVKYLNGLCSCNAEDPVEFLNWLSEKNALYIAEPFRYDLTEKYMSVIHQKEVNFVSQEEIDNPFCLNHTRLENHEIRTLVVVN